MILKLNDSMRSYLKKILLIELNVLKEDFVSISICNGYVYCKMGDFVIFYCEIANMEGEAEIELKPFHTDYLLFVINSYGICVISLSTKKQHYFEKAKRIIIDDVLNVGHEQLVIHFQQKFIVTDFDCCYHDTKLDSDSRKVNELWHSAKITNKGPTPHPSVIRSLEHKISVSLSRGQALEANIKEKNEMVKQCWDCLANLSLDQENYKPELSTLTKLFGRQQPNNLQSDVVRKIPVNIQFDFSMKWMRKFGDKLIFSFCVKNVCQTLYKVSIISLLFCNATKQFPTLSYTSSDQSTTCGIWEKSSNKEFLVSLDIPSTIFAADLNLNVNLHLRLDHKPYSIHLTSFDVARADILTINSIENKEFHTRDSEDNIAFEFVCPRKCFTLQSKITLLDKVFNIICNRLNCTKLFLGNLTILLLPQNMINGEIRLQNGRDYSEGVVYASSAEKLDLLISEIQNILPCDVIFQPVLSSSKVEKLREKLSKEVTLRRNSTMNNSTMITDDDVIIIDSPTNELCNDPKPDTLIVAISDTDQLLMSA